MAHWVLMKHASCARNRSIAVLLNLHKEGPEACVVVASYRGDTFYMSEYLTKELAYDRAEELELCFAGPEGDSSWSSVLQRASDRAHNRQPITSSWIGSAGEVAARFYDIGTWNWMVTMIQISRWQRKQGYSLSV
jgi:hypothetical protein